MDSGRFDELVKAVSDAASRRLVLKGLAALAGGAGFAFFGAAPNGDFGAEAKRCGGKKCKKPNNPCKKAVCKNQKCRKKDKPDGTGCGAGRICVNGQCIGDCQSDGGACAAGADCCSAVCACGDPTGWANKPDDDTCQADSYSQGFEQNLDGWFDFRNQFFETDPPNRVFPPQETIERVCEPLDGITPKSGDCFARVNQGIAYPDIEDLTALTTFGGFSNVFPEGGFETSIDIYLDPTDADDGQRFAYSVAINQDTCEWGGDFIFHVGKIGEDFCIRGGTDLDTQNGPAPCTTVQGNVPAEVTAEGWYTFVHEFVQDGGVLGVDMHVIGPDGSDVGTWEPAPVIPNADGGNRYGWFPWNDFEFVAIDNVERSS